MARLTRKQIISDMATVTSDPVQVDRKGSNWIVRTNRGVVFTGTTTDFYEFIATRQAELA